MTLSLYKNVYRLKKAFPAINTKEITEILNKKIQIRKNKKNSCNFKKSVISLSVRDILLC